MVHLIQCSISLAPAPRRVSHCPVPPVPLASPLQSDSQCQWTVDISKAFWGKDEFVEKQVTKFGNISFHLFQAEPCKKFNGIFRNLTIVVHRLKEDAALVLEK